MRSQSSLRNTVIVRDDSDSNDILPNFKNDDLNVTIDEQALVRLSREHKHLKRPF